MVQGVLIENGVIQNLNPATGELIEPTVSETSPEQLQAIISKANAAQVGWSNKTLDERVAAIREGLIAIEPLADKLAVCITQEMGKITAEAKAEVSNALALKGEWLDSVKEANKDVHLGGGEEGKAESVIIRDPLGVVAVISPWNVSSSNDNCILHYQFMSTYLTLNAVSGWRNSLSCPSSTSSGEYSYCQTF